MWHDVMALGELLFADADVRAAARVYTAYFALSLFTARHNIAHVYAPLYESGGLA